MYDFFSFGFKTSLFVFQNRDIEEGADMIMVKPGMAYLDIVRDVKEKVSYFIFSCQIFRNYYIL